MGAAGLEGPRMTVVQTADRDWKPQTALPPGLSWAPLWGDPRRGAYGLVARLPASYRVPLHSHANDVRVVMLKGTMVIGYPAEPEVEIAEGGYFLLPAKRAYVASCPKGCEFLAFDQLPFDILYAEGVEPQPAPGPRRMAVSADSARNRGSPRKRSSRGSTSR